MQLQIKEYIDYLVPTATTTFPLPVVIYLVVVADAVIILLWASPSLMSHHITDDHKSKFEL